ncbi:MULTISPECIES: disulfide bond formation protein B [Sphingomonas]|jgi:disulfide bond formation protein DsbB|uniref:Disulfide bond formation protein n=1 Tax=Sphingomonas hankookensis TaxID=563996 RepID=A0ABR5Y9R5_9SPHN|nr:MULTISPECIES: disulfide bond formation protein B [Sphingomonas]KZE11536.1 disulfide bond formation protein [Sphingomonas hankookensis]PZT94075.1 MAG: disulfide bond formation protein B [Sphingomonas sp.]
MRANDLPLARWIALLLPLTLIAGALASQYLGGLYPCEMCHWQRWPHYAAIGLAALSFVVPRTSGKRALVILAGIAILVSGAIGVFHAGVEYHWWQGITACANTLGATGGDLLAAIVRQPVVRCDVPQWTLFGISLAGFNAILSITGALAVLILATRRRT